MKSCSSLIVCDWEFAATNHMPLVLNRDWEQEHTNRRENRRQKRDFLEQNETTSSTQLCLIARRHGRDHR